MNTSGEGKLGESQGGHSEPGVSRPQAAKPKVFFRYRLIAVELLMVATALVGGVSITLADGPGDYVRAIVFLAGIAVFAVLSAGRLIPRAIRMKSIPLAAATEWPDALAGIVSGCGVREVQIHREGKEATWLWRVPVDMGLPSMYIPGTGDVIYNWHLFPELDEVPLWHEIGHAVAHQKGLWRQRVRRRTEHETFADLFSFSVLVCALPAERLHRLWTIHRTLRSLTPRYSLIYRVDLADIRKLGQVLAADFDQGVGLIVDKTEDVCSEVRNRTRKTRIVSC